MNLVKTGRWIFVDITLLYVPPVYYVHYGQVCWISESESESESEMPRPLLMQSSFGYPSAYAHAATEHMHSIGFLPHM